MAATVVIGLALALGWRYYSLQIDNHQHYVAASEENRVHVRPVAPTRGLIYDRNGVLLADNRPGFTLRIVVERSDGLTVIDAQPEHIRYVMDVNYFGVWNGCSTR